MRAPAPILVSLALAVQVKTATALSPLHSGSRLNPNKMTLAAIPSSSSAAGQPWGGRGVPSRTARESAVNVEWEPMSELDRRVEDGVNYEHLQPTANKRRPRARKGAMNDDDDDVPSTRGVFCGYRYTDDEYYRLKSASVDE